MLTAMGEIELRVFFERVHQRLGMWLLHSSFAEACAFLIGFNSALHGGDPRSGFLAGFREWLVARNGDRPELAFPALVLNTVAPGANPKSLTRDQDREAADALFALLDEYLLSLEREG
jgi:hypothetical protein